MNDDMLELSMWRDGNIMHGNCLEDMAKLKAERDEARREVLEGMHPDLRQGYAAAREWDCYKENTNEIIRRNVMTKEELITSILNASIEISRLTKERDEARREVCEWATCKQLTKERDEARREVCECKVHQQHDPRQYAQDRGWYCYKSDTLSQEVSQEGDLQ